MPDNSKRETLNKTAYAAGFLVIALSLVVRFLFLDIDPPYFFADTGQDLLSDPYNYTHFSRNKILYGQWDIFDYSRWVVFKYSLVSGVSYLIFMVGGVSRITANLSAVLLNLGGLFFFILAFWHQSKRAALIISLLLLTNITLLVFGRYPMMENGLIFMCGLLFYTFSRFNSSKWGLILSGVLLSLCGLTGKMFGMLLIIPMIFILWSYQSQRFIRQFAILVITALLSFILLAWLFYGSQIGNLYSFLGEHATGMYGTPEGLTSPIAFFEQLISLGRRSKLFYYAPFLLLMILVSSVVLITKGASPKAENHAFKKLLLFNIIWLVSGFLFLMIFNYRPLRYQLFLLLPLSGIIAIVMDNIRNMTKSRKLRWYHYAGILLVLWYGISQLVWIIARYATGDLPSKSIILIVLPFAVLILLIIYFTRHKLFGNTKIPAVILQGLLFLSILLQAGWVYKWFDKRSYNLAEAGEELVWNVDNRATLVGPYAQTLTIDNNLKSFIYWFGMSRKEADLFLNFPLTHLAVDESNQSEAIKAFPFLRSANVISRLIARGYEIRIIRVDDLIPGRDDIDYTPTDYEKASEFYIAGQDDSLSFYLQGYFSEYPYSKSGLTLLTDFFAGKGELDMVAEIYDTLISHYRRDYSLPFAKGYCLYNMYLQSKNRRYLDEADKQFDNAVEMFPPYDCEIARVKGEADSLFYTEGR